jgi:hypothetical protein
MHIPHECTGCAAYNVGISVAQGGESLAAGKLVDEANKPHLRTDHVHLPSQNRPFLAH